MMNSYCSDIQQDKIISEKIIEPLEGNDIKTVIIKYKNNNDQTVKRTVTYKVTKKMVKVLRSVTERKKWAKFGKALTEDNNCLVTYGDIVDLSMDPKIIKSDKTIKPKNDINILNIKDPAPILFKDRYKLDKFKKLKEGRNEINPENTVLSENSSKKYVPPSRRNNNPAPKSYSICISNIPLDITKDDFFKLGISYGEISRVYLPKDKYTGEGRGFGFIHYYNEENMNNAIKGINKKTYGYQILSVEIAKDIKSQ